MLAFLGSRVTGVAQLDCDRAAGRCTLAADGETIDEIALSRVTGAERRTLGPAAEKLRSFLA